MLGELQRHQDVIDLLSPLIERMEKDERFKQRLNAVMVSYSDLKSDLEFHRGLAALEKGKQEDAKSMLSRAFRMDTSNVDILIAMYRLKSDQEWNDLVLDTLRRTIHQVDLEVRAAESQASRFRLGNVTLGRELNQYAWLVSNTEGDYKKALEYSLRSLELSSDAAKLDTCARCYFALDDVENAIRMQRRALEQMPHSPPMIRQLAEFEAKLAEQSAASSEEP
jgi:tetratricopeptide (TPR) repeat protein